MWKIRDFGKSHFYRLRKKNSSGLKAVLLFCRPFFWNIRLISNIVCLVLSTERLNRSVLIILPLRSLLFTKNNVIKNKNRTQHAVISIFMVNIIELQYEKLSSFLVIFIVINKKSKKIPAWHFVWKSPMFVPKNFWFPQTNPH